MYEINIIHLPRDSTRGSQVDCTVCMHPTSELPVGRQFPRFHLGTPPDDPPSRCFLPPNGYHTLKPIQEINKYLAYLISNYLYTDHLSN